MRNEQTEAHSYNVEYCKSISTELSLVVEGLYTNEDGEEEYLCDWMDENLLDGEIVINLNRDFLGAKLWIGLGGPNVCIDTRAKEVALYWGTDRASYPLDEDTANAVEDYANSIWRF